MADEGRIIYEAIRSLIGRMVNDLIAETQLRISKADIACVEDVRAMGRPLVAFSPEMRENDATLKAFLATRMYRHYRVNRMTSKARRTIEDLFGILHAEPELLPPEWQLGCDGSRGLKTARRVCDFIAGMTDRFAILEHRRLFDLNAEA